MSTLTSSHSQKYYFHLRTLWITFCALWMVIMFWEIITAFQKMGIYTITEIFIGVIIPLSLSFMFWYMATQNYILIDPNGCMIRGVMHRIFISWENVDCISPVEIRGKKYSYGLILRRGTANIIEGINHRFLPDYLDTGVVALSPFVNKKKWEGLEKLIWLYCRESAKFCSPGSAGTKQQQ